MAFEHAGPPTTSAVTESRPDPKTGQLAVTGMMSRDWVQWFFTLMIRLNKTSQTIGSLHLPPTTSGAIVATVIPLPKLPIGFYRVVYSLRLITPAATSSRLQLILWWVEQGVWRSFTGRDMTANTVAAGVDNSSVPIYPDQGTQVKYEVTYASVLANSMKYALDLAVETVPQ